MRTLNNFTLLEPFLNFPTQDVFYFVQIMRRAKDHPSLSRIYNKVIRNYYINSEEEYSLLKPHIIKHCEESLSRAYIRLNKRSKKQNALRLMQKIADLMMYDQLDAVKNAFDSVAGEFHADPDKKWLIDIDYGKQGHKELEFFKLHYAQHILCEVPSFNGLHLICKPFNLRDLPQGMYSEIHKDNPTILYGCIP